MSVVQIITLALSGFTVLCAVGSVYFAVKTHQYRRQAEESLRQVQQYRAQSPYRIDRRWGA